MENMTIGATHNHPADLTIDPSLPMQPWAARFPNPQSTTLITRLGNSGARGIL